MKYKSNTKIINFLKENYKLRNKDLYITYLETFCRNDNEKEIINRVLRQGLQTNSLIRIKNHLIREGVVEDIRPEEREKMEKEVRAQYSPINGLLRGFFRYFK